MTNAELDARITDLEEGGEGGSSSNGSSFIDFTVHDIRTMNSY